MFLQLLQLNSKNPQQILSGENHWKSCLVSSPAPLAALAALAALAPRDCLQGIFSYEATTETAQRCVKDSCIAAMLA